MASKKTFKDSITAPAMSFISQESIDKAEGAGQATTPAETQPESAAAPKTAKAPEGYKLNPLYLETKSKRIQLLIQPSLHDKLKHKAQSEGTSVNDLIHTILAEAMREE